MTLADAAARRRALDPTGSFIVQAPAGSGKTGLLTHRFLLLLARVEWPEEILAITFTRKAAAEMRGRVLESLAAARDGLQPESDYERERQQAAIAALARDRERGWHLLDYPSRLRIFTIDSLCAGLTRQMPWLSGFGAQPAVTEDAAPLYLEAARATAAHLDGDEPGWSAAVGCLLEHLDNDLGLLERLLADMLPRRDQWLRHLAGRHGAHLTGAVEAAVEHLQGEVLAEAEALLPAEWRARLPALAAVAAANLADDPALALLGEYLRTAPDRLPPPVPAATAAWIGLVDLLLPPARPPSSASWSSACTTVPSKACSSRPKNAGR